MQTVIFLSTWFVGLLAFWLFIRFLVGQQTKWLLYMRDNIGRPNKIEKPLHEGNLKLAIVIASILSLVQLITGAWYYALLFGVQCVPFWSLVFDRMINDSMGNDKDYVGTGAKTDLWVSETFTGEKKNLYCIIAIILINAASLTILIIQTY
jgi:hypothetical protein